MITEMENDAYHASEGISKSGLWTIHTKSPAHYRFGVKKEATYFDVGNAAHAAILQPDLWESRYHRGPTDRRGHKWTNAQEFADHNGLTLLVERDYDAVLKIRDAVLGNFIVRNLVKRGEIEKAAFWTDEETDTICRCKPDLFVKEDALMADLKSTTNAGIEAAARSIANFGYHVQEAFYRDGWPEAGGGAVDATILIFFEKEPPFAVAIYETHPNVVEEGRAIYRRALRTYAACVKAAHWPAYPEAVQQIDMARWAYKEIAPVMGEE